MLKSFAFAMILVAASVGFARTAEENASVTKCYEEVESNYDLYQCAETDLNIADRDLNETYKRFQANMGKDADGKETKRLLTEAQRAWIKFRDANCSLHGAQMMGGTGQGLLVSQCHIQTTKDRTAELQNLMKNLGAE